jgi:N-sulfoglucosamine sulfohydrolase
MNMRRIRLKSGLARKVVGVAGVLLVSMHSMLAARCGEAADERPNILWIIAEDMGPELGCYGTKEVVTPTLDRLAEQGMLFRKAFTVTPVCSTSRSSFMTGMYAMAIDAHNHRSHRSGDNPLPDGVRVLTDWLRPTGYSTANITRLTADRDQAKFYRGTGKTDWNFAYPKDRQPFDLKDWDELKDRQPFFAQVNFSETHRGKAWNEAHQHIDHPADPKKVTIPPYYPDHAVTRAVWAQYLNAVMAVDKKVQFILDLLQRDGLSDNTVVVFMGDHGRAMPRGKQWPYDSGLRIPLIIYWPQGNASLPEPTGYERATTSDQLIASIDLSATTLSWAGVPKVDKMQGRIFLGADSDPPRRLVFGGRDRGDETVLHIRTARDSRYRYLRNKYPDRPFLQLNRYKESNYPIIGLLRKLDKQGELTGPAVALMADRRPAEELYDLSKDPWEINNLADSPIHQVVKKRLSDALDDWMNRIDDRGRIPEDPAIPADWEQRMRKNYGDRLELRPDDWFLQAPALGPNKVQ